MPHKGKDKDYMSKPGHVKKPMAKKKPMPKKKPKKNPTKRK